MSAENLERASAEASGNRADDHLSNFPAFLTAERTRRRESEANLMRLTGELMAKTGKPPEGWVPHEALHAARQKVKHLQAELKELRKVNTDLERQIEALRNPVPTGTA